MTLPSPHGVTYDPILDTLDYGGETEGSPYYESMPGWLVSDRFGGGLPASTTGTSPFAHRPALRRPLTGKRRHTNIGMAGKFNNTLSGEAPSP